MSGVSNDYNMQEGNPIVRVGNWVEEWALLEQTGLARGSIARNTATTARITQHTDDRNTWTSQQHDTHKLDLHKDISSVAPPEHQLNRKQSTREQLYRQHAIQLFAEEEAKKAEEKEKEMMFHRYGHKVPINRSRALDIKTTQPLTQEVLNQPAITFWSQAYGAGQLREGVTGTGSAAPFKKASTFSKPLSEEMQVQMR